MENPEIPEIQPEKQEIQQEKHVATPRNEHSELQEKEVAKPEIQPEKPEIVPNVEIPQPKKRGRPPGAKTKPKVVLQPVELVRDVQPQRRELRNEPRVVVRAPTPEEIHGYLARAQDRRRQQFFSDFHRRVMSMGGL